MTPEDHERQAAHQRDTHDAFVHWADREALDRDYGRIPADRYRERSEALDKRAVALDESFREDYEIGVSEDGTFSVGYSGYCGDCGLRFKFNHKAMVPP